VMIDPSKDKVTVDDEPIKLRSERGGQGVQPPVYIIMNKPTGVYTTNVAQGEQTRAIDLLPPGFQQRVYPVGRLDADTQGLLLLTNDGELTNKLGLTNYVLFMQDYGGPVGFRIFAERPGQVKGLIIQNANAYLDGVGDMPKQVFLPLWEKRNAATEAAARNFLKPETTRFQYTFGARDPEAISPDNWTIDQALLDRPGTDAYQLDLLENYKTNVALYDSWHAAFRKYQPKTLIVWGKNDPFFIPAGAEAFKRDLPKAKLVWLDGGHFALEENVALVAHEIDLAFAGE